MAAAPPFLSVIASHGDCDDPEFDSGIVFLPQIPLSRSTLGEGAVSAKRPCLSMVDGDDDATNDGITMIGINGEQDSRIPADHDQSHVTFPDSNIHRGHRRCASRPDPDIPFLAGSNNALDLEVFFNYDGTEQDSADLLLHLQATLESHSR